MSAFLSSRPNKKSKFSRTLGWIFSVIIFTVILVYVAFQVSPWPSVLLIRYSLNDGGTSVDEALAKYVPNGIASKFDLQYDSSSSDAMLDLYYPELKANINTKRPLIIWVHGGGFVAGDKKELSSYCKILASKDFVVAALNYSVAPESKYPVPVSQLNTAIAFLVRHAEEFTINTSQIFVAGDSGGAHITAQLANVFTNSEYAAILGITPSIDPKNLKGIILHCGPYNAELVNFEGAYGSFLKTVLWSYIGSKDFIHQPKFVHFSVSNFVTDKFPRTFISVGNEDPLRVHSYDLASKLSSKGVNVDSLFFSDEYSPGLPHEYQFNLDNDAGKLALERTIKFLLNCVNEAK